AQAPSQTIREGEDTTIRYDAVVAENGARYAVALSVHVKSAGGALHFSADICNGADGLRVNELQLPFAEFERLSSEPDEEVLYIPNALGARHENPREYIRKNFHSEYLQADDKGVWFTSIYPPTALWQLPSRSLSMPWLGVQSGEHFLYAGRHDAFFRIAGLSVGAEPRGAESRLSIAVSQYPAAAQGEALHYGGGVLAAWRGDWRDGSAFYRQWAERTWMKAAGVAGAAGATGVAGVAGATGAAGPKIGRPPDWVAAMPGWQRIICKHQYGEIFYKYADLPRVYEEGRKHGIGALMLFAWHKGGHDASYPELEPCPTLGGAEGLRAAIKTIQGLGGKVILYSNGQLIDVNTGYYRDIGRFASTKDIAGNEYRERYGFSNDGTVLKSFQYRSFASACHATGEWRKTLLDLGRLKLDLGADSIFYDQIANAAKLCFDKTHLHGARIDEEPHWQALNLDAIKGLLGEGQALGTECFADRLTARLHYTHGIGAGAAWSGDAYADLFRHTFPECIASNRMVHDEKEDFREHLNHAFVYGLIFDIAIYRGRADLSAAPEYARHIERLLAIKEKYRKYFYGGRFESAYDLRLPASARAAKYASGDGFIVALWNNAEQGAELDVFGKKVAVRAKSVDVVEFANG
ncbi:MAG: DUF6259 domain-containing protein, partial [Clostridiales bacterium]|nr:DUF6259 domain-containing protein [Clostridiales bacterium]